MHVVSRTLPRSAALLALALVTLAVVPNSSRAADTPIQPGGYVVNLSTGDQCTLNFVFRNQGRVYIGTAGHCSKSIGERMATGDPLALSHGPAFGTVAWRIENGTDDFSLIAVDTARSAEVNPAVRHYGGPTGYTTSQSVSPGEEVWLYGQGVVVGFTEPTRARPGVLVGADGNSYRIESPAVNGDSGGPFLEASTGKALGVVSQYGATKLQPYTDIGPTVERILSLTEAAGYHLSLVTASLA